MPSYDMKGLEDRLVLLLMGDACPTGKSPEDRVNHLPTPIRQRMRHIPGFRTCAEYELPFEAFTDSSPQILKRAGALAIPYMSYYKDHAYRTISLRVEW